VTSPDGVQVNPAELRQVGLDVQKLSSQVAGTLSGHEDAVQPTGSSKGWDAWQATVYVGGQWVTELRAVSSDVNAVGIQLVNVADGYQSTDRQSADAFRNTHGQ
jgi:hypothetical protein